MHIEIKYQDIIDHCEKLSSFEANGRYDGNGASRYLEIHINKVDEQLIQQYILQARSILEERMERMIVGMDDTHATGSTTVTVFDDTEAIEFDKLIVGSELSNYVVDDNPFANISDNCEAVYLGEGMNKFAMFTNSYAGDGKYYLFTNIESMSSLGVRRFDFIEEPDVKKVYKLRESGKEYTWASLHNGGHTGAGLIEFNRGYVTKVVEMEYPAFVWEINSGSRWKYNSTFLRHVSEAMASYAMAQWLRGKLDDRVSFYENLFNNSFNMAVKNIFTKQAPSI